ncbi:MAG TPA: type II toxin-antitoxin system RelE/ParE family toxin [Pirellulales bacterium]|nr:type II toxin-antitoxin system RelE/ParE family toxin [Pirellulales bacterium]
MPFQIQYAEAAANDIRALRAFDQRKVLDGIEEHLTHQPQQTSRSRIKAMGQPFWSQYRLRIDDFRIYYDIDEENHVVNVLRVLEKGAEATPLSPTENRTEDENSNLDR